MTDAPSPPGVTAGTQKELPTVRAPDYRIQFANHLRMRIGIADLGISFGILDELPGIGPVGYEKSLVMMTPVVAKQLSMALIETLKAYEAKFGAITLTQDVPLDRSEILDAIARGREAISKPKQAS
jgi:hypothetical protein